MSREIDAQALVGDAAAGGDGRRRRARRRAAGQSQPGQGGGCQVVTGYLRRAAHTRGAESHSPAGGKRPHGRATEIAGLYEGYRAEAERTVEAQVISAVPVDAAQQQQIIAALKKRLGREVTLSCETDATLLGGAIIRAGDLVIDGSVTGQLAKLEVALAG
ncbi:MAG: ATP synthase F1 subunit delta [Gammaproteobacteria bacterium]